MNAKATDNRPRLDSDTSLVKRARSGELGKIGLLTDVKKLPRDAAWQKIESRIVAHNGINVAPFEE